MESLDSEDETALELFQLCSDVIKNDKNPKAAFERIVEIKESCSDVPSILLDVLVGVEGETNGEGKEADRKRLIELIDLLRDNVLPRDVLAMELDCVEANLPANKQQLVRLKTRLFFKQSKFNLLREESEGYAKLITELLDSETAGGISSKSLVTRLLCLIGQFNLDPNRVTDIVLECFECCPQRTKLFISLLREIKANREYLCTLLGFKYTFYQSENKSTPFSLYTLTAALLEADLVDLSKITAFMKPNSDGIKETHKSRAANAASRAKKAETIMTSQIPLETNRLNMDSHSGDTNQSIVGVSFAQVTSQQEDEDKKIMGDMSEKSVLGVNQKLGLVCALAEAGVWHIAKQLIDRMPEYYAVQASPRVSKAIADLVDAAISPFYLQHCSRQLEGIAASPPSELPANCGVPMVTSWSSLCSLSSVLWYLGPRIAYRPQTATKLIRLIAVFYRERQTNKGNTEDKVAHVLMDIVDECLLPSLSLIPSSPNAALSEELWALLQLFPYTWRYRLYGRWKTHHTIRHPELNIARGKVLGRTKYVLKRLSKETVKVMGRQLGKLCHIHPITVFDYLLSQVQTFDSLIQPVVESIKFMTNLEFDILSYCIIEQLASPDKQQLKASDGTLSPWLQALATLVGAIYKKYNVELAGILNYVANQLKNEKSFDLLILREIIQNMSSVESVQGATQDQLEALQGGESLRMEAGGFSNTRNKRASNRLKEAVLEGDIAVGMCILIAQARECVVHNDSSEFPLKLVGEMVDQCRDTLMQFCSFLLSNVKSEEYCRRMPPSHLLIGEYNVPIDTAMYLARATYMPKVNAAYDATKKERKLLEAESKQKLDVTHKFLFFKSAMDGVVDELISDLTPQIPQHVNYDIPSRLMVVFWMLSLYDIEVPTSAYEKAIESTKKQAKEAADNLELSKSRRVREEERLRGVETRLREDQRKQTEHVERMRMWLAQSKDALFEASRTAQTASFIQTCIMPRVLFSELDAIYCARLVILLHQQRTTFFQTLVFIDKIFADLLPLFSGLSENEAVSFGRFLEMILSHALRWHSDPAIFEQECSGFPGFITKVVQHDGQKSDTTVSYNSYRALMLKYQMKMSKVFLTILQKESNEYVVLRNCLVIMTKLVSCFPLLKESHASVEQAVNQVRDWEKGRRDDLSLKAASYAGRLRMSGTKLYERNEFAPGQRITAKPSAAASKKTAASPSVNKERKRAVADGTPKKAKKAAKTERNENEGESVAKEETAEKETEEGEVPPSPPPKKLRIPPLTENSPSNGKERNGKEHRKRRQTTEQRNSTRNEERRDERRDERRQNEEREQTTEEQFAGPALPPSLKREDKHEGKGLKRGNRESRDGDNGDVKIPKKDRESVESRVSRPAVKSRSATPKLEKKEKKAARESKSRR